MDILQAILLSVVEGISEFLPISSTGHLVLTSELLHIPQTEFVKSFEIIIQLGAILAVVILYWKKYLTSIRVWERILIAFIPTIVIGFTLYELVKDVLLGNSMITVLALFVGGVALIILELLYKERDHHADSIEHLTRKQAFLIGIFQSISIIPGVSRAAATIVGGLYVGAKRKPAVEFSFLLAVPTMLAAATLDIVKTKAEFTQNELLLLLVGFIGAFITALFAIKFLVNFIKNHTFIPFGIYRIILSILFFLFVLT